MPGDFVNRVQRAFGRAAPRAAALSIAAALLTAAPAPAQQFEDEWYDPTDWFDGNNDDYEDYYDYDYDVYTSGEWDFELGDWDYERGRWDYDLLGWDREYEYGYYTDDWYDYGQSDFDRWYDA